MERLRRLGGFVADVAFGVKVRGSSLFWLVFMILAPVAFVIGSHMVAADDLVMWITYMTLGPIVLAFVEIMGIVSLISGRNMAAMHIYPDRIQWTKVNLRANWGKFDEFRKDRIGHGPFLCFDHRFGNEPVPYNPEFWDSKLTKTSHWLYERLFVWEVAILFSDPNRASLTLPIVAFAIAMGVLLAGGFIMLAEGGYFE